MMAADFTPERSEAIEQALIEHVSRHPGRGRHASRTIALLVTGALVGAGATASAFAATDTMPPAVTEATDAPDGEPTPDLPDAFVAPAGVTPGTPLVSAIADPVAVIVAGDTVVPLTERPDEATHARVIVSPTGAGSLSFGTDPGGNNPSAAWSPSEIGRNLAPAASYDFPLDTSVEALYLAPSGFAGTVTVQFVTHVPTRLGVNSSGQTFGTSGGPQGEPDLIAVIATNGRTGYVSQESLDEASGAHVANPEEVLAWQEENAGTIIVLPVYESDGTTQIGEFQLDGP
ncbi:hypothetical protein OCAE111667_17960 [Occultella aeris]|uniref:Uncharacterized protein n=2 Tax=Occultella aeris TaxID=2761496 RepID=A0A7M4DNL0_9MICO|nr:hypothetical protein HALOF300_03741 [Occultella aeris]